MFDSLKAMGAMAALVKNKEAVAEAFARVLRELESRTVTVEGARQPDGTPGIVVIASGKLEIVSITLAPALLAASGDEPGRARLQQLISGATNAALKRAKELLMGEISREAKALGLPEMPGLETLLGNASPSASPTLGPVPGQ
jgi:DNA-binding protein YbaB